MPARLVPRLLAAALLLLVLQRVAYHAAYLADDPFALATFSDGRLYERAAEDIVGHPPWGERPFYLQGVYAYLLALPMGLRPGPSLGLLLQLAIVVLGLVAFSRACKTVHGKTTGTLAAVLLLAYPGLSFYENKYLTAALASASMAFMLGALAWCTRESRPRAAVAFGAAMGLAILARGNVLLGLPGFVIAMLLVGRRHHGRGRNTLLAFGAGLLLSLAPMAIRNATVTGRATVFPAHGGGTSFYIGNNAGANGLWNDAGGLLSGDVGQERTELVQRLQIPEGTEAEQAAAIGRALYRRAWSEIADDPGRWLALEAKKAWLLVGNEELSQDYDLLGEQELIGTVGTYGVPLPVLLGLALTGMLGFAWPRRQSESDPDAQSQPAIADVAFRRAWLWTLAGMAVAVVGANILFFTSAQHRAPLAVVLAALAAPGVMWTVDLARDPTRPSWQRIGPILLVLAVVLQGLSARTRPWENPSAAHYHNLALVEVEIGQPRAAVQTLSRALQVDPDHPVIRIERASLQRKLGMMEGASLDLDVLAARDDLPRWIAERVAEERRRVDALMGLRRDSPQH